jgi:lipopolysaccharide export system permease protein
MRRIQRYVLRECLSPTILGLCVYVLLFLVKILFDLAELAIRKHVALSLLLRFLLLAIPNLLVLTIPVAVLLGVLIGMGRLSREGELTALRACGVSYLQILPPILVLGVLGGAITGYNSLFLVPKTRFAQHRLNAELLMTTDLVRSLKARVFYQSIPGILLYTDRISPSGMLRDVILVQTEQDDKEGGQTFTLARKARLEQDAEGGIRVLLQRGETHSFDPEDPRLYQRSEFEKQVLARPPDPEMLAFVDTLRGGLKRNHNEMSTRAVRQALRLPPGDPNGFPEKRKPRVLVEYHRRFALPVGCLIFALLGFPLGIVTKKGGRSSGFALSLGVVLGYWLLLTSVENLAREGAMPPWLAVWLPNILCFTGSLLLLAWLVRDRRLGVRLPSWLRWPSLRRSGPGPHPRLRRAAGSRPSRVSGRLDWYLIEHFGRAFILVLSSFYLIYFLADLRTLLDDIAGRDDLTFSVIASYFGMASPGMILAGLPLATLFGALLSLGLLERNNEITAMKAAGISLYRVSAPVLLVSIGLGAVHFLVTDYVLPASNTRAAELRAKIRGIQRGSAFGPRQWIFGQERRLYNFAIYRKAREEYQGVTIYRLSEDWSSLQERIEARTARWDGRQWVMANGWIRSFDGSAEIFRSFDEERFTFPETPEYFNREVRTPQQMSFQELQGYISDLRQSGYEVQELQVALYEKLSMAAVPFVLVLLGLPYAFRMGRRGSLSGVGMALVIVMVYYLFLAAFRQLGGVGLVPPLLAALSPDLIFASLGTVQLLSLRT